MTAADSYPDPFATPAAASVLATAATLVSEIFSSHPEYRPSASRTRRTRMSDHAMLASKELVVAV